MSRTVMRIEKKSTSAAVRSANHSVRRKDRAIIPTQLRARTKQGTKSFFDDMSVHYDSDMPSRLDVLAYTQGMHFGGVARGTDVGRGHQTNENGAGKGVAIIQRMRNNVVQRCGTGKDGSNPVKADFIVSPKGIVIDSNISSIPKTQFTVEKLQHEFKHAGDFGIAGKWNRLKAVEYRQAIECHISNATDIFFSQYRGENVYVYYNRSTQIGAYVDLQGSYVGGWKFSEAQINYHMNNGIKLY